MATRPETMSIELELAITVGLFLVLMASGLYIALAIMIPALVYLFMQGGLASLNSIGFIAWGTLDSFTLTAIPLFILMAEVLGVSGLSTRVYDGMGKLVAFLPGGLLQTNIAGCAVFSSVSGSSVATAAAIGRVALPQLAARKYSPRLATGSLAAGGTLGILIPPSLVMIVYSSFTQTSVPKLFLAGMVPGFLLTAFFMAFIAARSIIYPHLAPREKGPKSVGEAARAVLDVAPFFIIVAGSLGSLYAGWVTTSEAATIGCVLAIALGALVGDMTFAGLYEAIRKTILFSGAILFLVLAAYTFTAALGFGGMNERVEGLIRSLQLSKFEFYVALFVLYLILGMFIESIPMILITVPLVFPLLPIYDIDPLLFGIVLVIFVELALITPPMGMNLFVIQGISGEPLGNVVRGVLPFCVIVLLTAVLMVVWPDLALWLPAALSVR
jgi:tripartite ATP-independent transporter DctM subunit